MLVVVVAAVPGLPVRHGDVLHLGAVVHHDGAAARTAAAVQTLPRPVTEALPLPTLTPVTLVAGTLLLSHP